MDKTVESGVREAIAAILLRRVNAPESVIYEVAREIAALSKTEEKAGEALKAIQQPDTLAWPPLKKAIWDVVVGESLNDGHYINAWSLTDKLYEAASSPAGVTVPEGMVLDMPALKRVCTAFFYWWFNQPGANTQQGFDSWLEAEGRSILAAAPASPPAQETEWPTIDSAPKDGRPILVTNAGEGMLCRIVEWRDKWRGRSKTPENGWCIVHSDNACMDAPSHWHPLPAPPSHEPAPQSAEETGR